MADTWGKGVHGGHSDAADGRDDLGDGALDLRVVAREREVASEEPEAGRIVCKHDERHHGQKGLLAPTKGDPEGIEPWVGDTECICVLILLELFSEYAFDASMLFLDTENTIDPQH